mgnify:CR=1 FL=1
MTQSTKKKAASKAGSKSSTRETARAKGERLQRRVDALQRGLAIVDFDASERITDVSEEFLALTGHKREALVGAPHRSLISACDAADPDYAGPRCGRRSRSDVRELPRPE